MKSILLAKVLTFSLPAAVALAPLAPAYHPQRGVTVAAQFPLDYTLVVRHREAARFCLSTSSRCVSELRLATEHALATALPGVQRQQAIRNLLQSTYGSRLSQSQAQMGYSLQWDPVREQWVIVCSEISTFVVDFGAHGSVELTLTENS